MKNLSRKIAGWFIDQNAPLPYRSPFGQDGARPGWQLLLGRSNARLNVLTATALAPEIANSKLSFSIVPREQACMIRDAIGEKVPYAYRALEFVSGDEMMDDSVQTKLAALSENPVGRHLIIERPETPELLDSWAEKVTDTLTKWCQNVLDYREIDERPKAADRPHILITSLDAWPAERLRRLLAISYQFRAIGAAVVIHHNGFVNPDGEFHLDHVAASSNLEHILLAEDSPGLNGIISRLAGTMLEDFAHEIARAGGIRRDGYNKAYDVMRRRQYSANNSVLVGKKLVIDAEGGELAWRDVRLVPQA